MSYILLVEDNLDNAQMMIRLLESIGQKVKHAEQGLNGVKLAREERPNLILMDFNLPDIDGRTLVLTMKKQLGTTEAPPIIAVTARTGATEQALAARFGCSAFINKPFDPQEFLDIVQSFLDPSHKPENAYEENNYDE